MKTIAEINAKLFTNGTNQIEVDARSSMDLLILSITITTGIVAQQKIPRELLDELLDQAFKAAE